MLEFFFKKTEVEPFVLIATLAFFIIIAIVGAATTWGVTQTNGMARCDALSAATNETRAATRRPLAVPPVAQDQSQS